MGEKEVKKFELNTKALENFEKIMATKLDEIEELKITSLDQGSKLINIISLCANVKTLILEGDQRLNCDRILTNIFKPELVENLFLNNVKIPNVESLKKYTNLKMISLNDIRFCNINDFFAGITNPEKIEIINIANTDFSNNSIEILKKFNKFKYLNLNNIKNAKFDKLGFLKNNENILKISIANNSINISEIDNLLKCRCSKSINVDIVDEKGKIIKNSKFLEEDNQSEITVSGEQIEEFSKKINLYRIQKINVIINKKIEKSHYIKMLKKFKSEIEITIENFSNLDIEQARKIKDILKLENIKVLENGEYKEYNIDEYIRLRKQIDEIINSVSKHVSQVEKFLEIYRFLGKEYKIEEDTNRNFSQILQNCLGCMNIKSNIIVGEDLENEKEHSWNQVELEGKWYNVDLAMDIEKIKKKKTEYCLLGDKDFLETHLPKSGKNNYCNENFNPKIINVFFKTGLFKEKLLESYVEMTFEKIKKIFNINKKQEILALPSANEKNK